MCIFSQLSLQGLISFFLIEQPTYSPSVPPNIFADAKEQGHTVFRNRDHLLKSDILAEPLIQNFQYCIIFLVSAVTAEWGFLKHTANMFKFNSICSHASLSSKIPLGKLVQHEEVKLMLESLTLLPNKKQ